MNPPHLLHNHLFAPTPKRILSLEGGGVRGALSLAFLERIEALLRARANRPDLRLCEYFSLVGGTSTGAIIAAGLALGHSVGELIDLYLNISRESFVRRTWAGFQFPGGTLIPKFQDEALREAILRQFGPETLGSDRLACGLGIVAKRLDSASVWLFHNHPNGPYYTHNRDLKIANLLRASTAAPGYFGPEMLEVAPGLEGLFVDGALGPHNNPSLLLLMLATLEGYGFRWPMGGLAEDARLTLVSIGTGGTRPQPLWGETYRNKPPAILGVEALFSMMHDAGWLAQAMLQWMSSSPTAWQIDTEVGDLRNDVLGGKNAVHYLRYDAPLERDWLREHLGVEIEEAELRGLREIDRPENTARLIEIGRRAAARQIHDHHLPK